MRMVAFKFLIKFLLITFLSEAVELIERIYLVLILYLMRVLRSGGDCDIAWSNNSFAHQTLFPS